MNCVPTHPSIRPARRRRLAGLLLVIGLALAGTIRPNPAAGAAGIGDPAPDFTAENILDTAPDFFQLSAYRGQVVVMSFFAYW